MDLTDSWARSLRASGRSQRTLDAYLEDVDMLTLHRAGLVADRTMDRRTVAAELRVEHPIEECTRGQVEQFLIDCRERGLADATVARRYRSLQQFFRWCHEEGEIEVNPMGRMKPPKVVDRPPPIITVEEMTALLAACRGPRRPTNSGRLATFERDRDTALVTMLRWSGVRASEIMGLAVVDVNLDVETFTVTGKGGRVRTIAMLPASVEAVDRYLRTRSRHPHAAVPALWLGRKGRLGTDGLRQMLERRCADAGLDPINPHRFRHTFAHEAKVAGMSDESLMQVAGWQSAQMLQRYGRSASAERAQAEHRRIFG